MENITDDKKLETVLNALGKSAHAFSKEMGYKSPASVYHILNQVNSLSQAMKDRILKVYPNVNALFLSDDSKLPVLLSGPELQTQMNLHNIPTIDSQGFMLFKKFLDLPNRLDKIERNIEIINKKLNNINGDDELEDKDELQKMIDFLETKKNKD